MPKPPAHCTIADMWRKVDSLLLDLRKRETVAAERVRRRHPDFKGASDEEIFAAADEWNVAPDRRNTTIADVIAREYGCEDWQELENHVNHLRGPEMGR